MLRFISQTSTNGVTEELFTLPFSFGDIPGVLWSPESATGSRPLIFIGHGGGQHKQSPGVVARAHRFAAECGFAVVAVDSPAHGGRPQSAEHQRLLTEMRTRFQSGGDATPILAELHALIAGQSAPEWQAILDEVQKLDHVGPGPVGYWGISMGCALGIPFVAAEPRVRAAVLGLNGTHTAADGAERITIPLEFLVQWDDEMVPRAASLALFDRFGSPEKTLHANPGKHVEIPPFEVDSSLRFFTRHLT
ncbi:alpha/beta hydrolase [Herbidospora sp. RD11066]